MGVALRVSEAPTLEFPFHALDQHGTGQPLLLVQLPELPLLDLDGNPAPVHPNPDAPHIDVYILIHDVDSSLGYSYTMNNDVGSVGSPQRQGGRRAAALAGPARLPGVVRSGRQGDRFALVRNYDFPAELCERHFMGSRRLGRGVVGMSECLWGLDDGMNDQGLAISLTFGGSRAVGEGFGIPLILRYVFQVCGSVEEAVEVFRRVPSHMAYNVTVLDREGECRTVRLHPERALLVTAEPHATNPQLPIDDPAYTWRTRSLERLRHLEIQARAPASTLDAALDRFLESPLHEPTEGGRFPTLYTVAYDPVGARAVVAWPGEPRWTLGPEPFPTERRNVRLRDAFEHQLRLVRVHGRGVPDGRLRKIRRDLERTGSVPWERLAELWGGAGGRTGISWIPTVAPLARRTALRRKPIGPL